MKVPGLSSKLRPDFRVLLFDVDGTLMRAPQRGRYRELISRLLRDVFGTAGNLRQVDFAGRTDQAIFAEALESEGFRREDLLARLPVLRVRAAELVRELSAGDEIFLLCPGVLPLLEALAGDDRFVSALLTGNIEELAGAKLQAVGIGRYFPLRGAYGSDAEDRNALPEIAARRLRDQIGKPILPRQMVIIGDTPRDIECARHFGARVMAVATGIHSRSHLSEFRPDLLLEDLSDTGRVMELLAGL